jgi:hypothetical protein
MQWFLAQKQTNGKTKTTKLQKLVSLARITILLLGHRTQRLVTLSKMNGTSTADYKWRPIQRKSTRNKRDIML